VAKVLQLGSIDNCSAVVVALNQDCQDAGAGKKSKKNCVIM
jgi:hypothetical protein